MRRFPCDFTDRRSARFSVLPSSVSLAATASSLLSSASGLTAGAVFRLDFLATRLSLPSVLATGWGGIPAAWAALGAINDNSGFAGSGLDGSLGAGLAAVATGAGSL